MDSRFFTPMVERIDRALQNEAELVAIQETLARKIDLSDRCSISEIKTVSGVDLACWNDKDGSEVALCCIVTIDLHTKTVLETACGFGSSTLPYTPGFLAFREMPAIMDAYKRLSHKPDLLMLDGNGYLHKRHMGLATHAAIELNTPAIGVAKSYLKIDGVDYIMPENEVGAYKDIVIRGEVYGRVLRTQRNVKPIFVSSGNWISLDTATNITLSLITHTSRQPMPTRLADMYVRKIRKTILSDRMNDLHCKGNID